MQINAANLAAIYFNIQTGWQGAFDAATPWSDALVTRVPSSTRENRYAWLGLIPRMREWVGERQLNNIGSRAMSVVNKDWEDTLALDRNDIEDDNLGLFAQSVQQLGRQAKLLPDDVILAVLAANATCFDGQAFFNASHPKNVDDSAAGTYSNYDSTGVALTPTNYQAVRARMMSYVGEDGKPLAIRPDLLIVPPALEAQGKQILESDLLVAAFGVNSATGAQNNIHKGTARLLVIPELAGTDTTWYLADTSKPVKPFVYQERKAPMLVALDSPTSENLFFRKKFIYGIDARSNGAMTLPFLMNKMVA